MEIEPQLIENYIATGKVKLIYRHLLQLGDGSRRAAEASECASDQGRFWEMRKLLYQRQGDVSGASDIDQTLSSFARELGMDEAVFSECLTSGKHQAEVAADYEAAQAEGVHSRPVFVINGRQIIGGRPYAVFAQTIEAALRN